MCVCVCVCVCVCIYVCVLILIFFVVGWPRTSVTSYFTSRIGSAKNKGASYYTKEKNMGPGVSFVFRVVKFNFVLLFESYDLKYSEEA